MSNLLKITQFILSVHNCTHFTETKCKLPQSVKPQMGCSYYAVHLCPHNLCLNILDKKINSLFFLMEIKKSLKKKKRFNG